MVTYNQLVLFTQKTPLSGSQTCKMTDPDTTVFQTKHRFLSLFDFVSKAGSFKGQCASLKPGISVQAVTGNATGGRSLKGRTKEWSPALK